MLSKSFHVNQSVGVVPGGKPSLYAFLSYAQAEPDCPSGHASPEESDTESEHEYEDRRCTFISMNYKCISVHISRQSLYNPFSIAVKNQTRKKRTAEK